VAQETAIEWTDVSWNPVHGCSKVSTGCKHCYAETLSLRYGQTSAPWTARNAAQNVMLKPHKLREPLSKAGPWKNPCRVFVNSMSDLFHEEIPYEYIGEVFRVMEKAKQHTFQVLTKRPERMAEVVADLYACGLGCGEVLSNVWLGVSIESRKWVGRADVLRATPAAVRFISAEPLLGPIVIPGEPTHGFDVKWPDGRWSPELNLTGIDWLIVGGESGPGHRPFDPQWARDLRDACALTDTALFVKQLGGSRPGTKLEDLPEDLRIREFPAVARATIRG
jgi:protein gp37